MLAQLYPCWEGLGGVCCFNYINTVKAAKLVSVDTVLKNLESCMVSGGKQDPAYTVLL